MPVGDLPEWALAGRAHWRWTGAERPPWAVLPGPGQESVWDYPRPPLLEADPRRVIVRLGDTLVADTCGAVRLLETASPPTFYLPPVDVRTELLIRTSGGSRCEWKGEAVHWTVRTPDGRVVERGAWSYEDPFEEYRTIRGYISVYPARFECSVDGERVTPQAGGFYGGWVTSEVTGPFKGDPGSAGW